MPDAGNDSGDRAQEALREAERERDFFDPPAAPSESSASGDVGFSEETCVRCGWRMGSRALNCQNNNTPHVFPSQAPSESSASPEPRCGQSERDHFEKDGVRYHAVPDYSTGEPNKVRAVPCPCPPASSRHGEGLPEYVAAFGVGPDETPDAPLTEPRQRKATQIAGSSRHSDERAQLIEQIAMALRSLWLPSAGINDYGRGVNAAVIEAQALVRSFATGQARAALPPTEDRAALDTSSPGDDR